MRDVGQPVTRDQEFLAAVCDRLDYQNELLSGLRDQMVAAAAQPATAAPSPATAAGAGPPKDSDGGVVELKEPAPLGRAKPPARKPAAGKTPARKPRTATQKKGT